MNAECEPLNIRFGLFSHKRIYIRLASGYGKRIRNEPRQIINLSENLLLKLAQTYRRMPNHRLDPNKRKSQAQIALHLHTKTHLNDIIKDLLNIVYGARLGGKLPCKWMKFAKHFIFIIY